MFPICTLSLLFSVCLYVCKDNQARTSTIRHPTQFCREPRHNNSVVCIVFRSLKIAVSLLISRFVVTAGGEQAGDGCRWHGPRPIPVGCHDNAVQP